MEFNIYILGQMRLSVQRYFTVFKLKHLKVYLLSI